MAQPEIYKKKNKVLKEINSANENFERRKNKLHENKTILATTTITQSSPDKKSVPKASCPFSLASFSLGAIDLIEYF